MFPGPGANIIRNEAGEPLGWDYPPDEPYEPDDDDDNFDREEELYCTLCGGDDHERYDCPEDESVIVAEERADRRYHEQQEKVNGI